MGGQSFGDKARYDNKPSKEMKENVEEVMDKLDNTKRCDPYYTFAVQCL